MATAIQKTFKCIEALAQAPTGLTVSQAAAIAGLSWPAANRLLEGLTNDAIVVRDEKSKRYRLGASLYAWSNTAMQASTPINIARKEIIKLSMDTGRQVNFLIMEGLEIVIVERCEIIDGVPVNKPMPARRIWYESGTGKAIVAFSSSESRQSTLKETYKRKGLKPPPQDALENELDEVYARGYAISWDIRPADLVGIVSPVLGLSGHAVAAIGTFMQSADLDSESGSTLIAQLGATASRISHYLGVDDRTLVGVS